MKRLFIYIFLLCVAVSCAKSEIDSEVFPEDPNELPSGDPITSFSVGAFGDVSTRVGIDMSDPNIDNYFWLEDDEIVFCELNSSNTAFTGKNYVYSVFSIKDDGTAVFAGTGLFSNCNYVAVHVRKKFLIDLPIANAKTFKFNIPRPDVSDWIASSEPARQEFADNLIFSSAPISGLDIYNGSLDLKIQLTQVDVLVKSTISADDSKVVNMVRLVPEVPNAFAKTLTFNLDGSVTPSDGGAVPATYISNLRLSTGNTFRARFITRAIYATAVKTQVFSLGNIASANVASTNKMLHVGKIYVLSQDVGALSPILDDGNAGVMINDKMSYTGAFWRASQRGERIIRIPVTLNANAGAWTASVYQHGNYFASDDIVLDSSYDPNSSYPMNNNLAENFLVTNSPTASHFVQGTISSAVTDKTPEYIEFRIGLASEFNNQNGYNELTNPARYATVIITYADEAKKQLLFLRQGHDPDYLFSVTDPYGNDQTAWASAPNWRPSAVKISPYNLTASKLIDGSLLGGQSIKNHPQVGPRDGVFTEYPTQAGAFWQWAKPTTFSDINDKFSRRAYHPSNPYAPFKNSGLGINDDWNNYNKFSAPYEFWSSGTAPNRIMDIQETCPVGYHRPTDGITSGSNHSGEVIDSEFRQSFFVSPPVKEASTATPNEIWGYYADGYFDRRTLTPPAGAKDGASAVENTSANVAYVGKLFFNPTTKASVFLPAAGHRTGALAGAGRAGTYWTSSATFSSSAWYLFFGTDGSSIVNFGRTYGYNIRCVKD